MKLIKQITLHYQEGRSNKIYEVDLCELGSNQYVVNFRYGRLGKKLNEGTKTIAPETLTKAQRIFWELVGEKQKKGYQIIAGGDPKEISTPEKTPQAPALQKASEEKLDARAKVVLEKFIVAKDKALRGKEAPKNKKSYLRSSSQWHLDRIVWRVGELQIKAAVPHLIELLGKGKPLRKYCVAWALGACRDQRAIKPLQQFYQTETGVKSAAQIALIGLGELLEGAEKAQLIQEQINTLPEPLKSLVTNGSPEQILQTLQNQFRKKTPSTYFPIETLYLINSELTRPVIRELLKTAPLKPPYFQRFRHIFKAAELRRDGEIFGLLAYRFEKEAPMFRKPGPYAYYVRLRSGGYLRPKDLKSKLQSLTPEIAFGEKTKTYFRKRVWRTLNTLGEQGDLDYVNMAAGVLLPFTDNDAQRTRKKMKGWRRPYTYEHWDAYAPYWAFNHILYRHSSRYEKQYQKMLWKCQTGYEPGKPVPNQREEAYPKLWQKRPAGLVHLLVESQCLSVHQFAVKALKTCKEVCDSLETELLILLLEKPYNVTAEFAFSLAKDRIKLLEPDKTLVLAIANCSFQEGREESYRWIESNRAYFLQDKNFVFSLATSPQGKTRNFATELLRTSPYQEKDAQNFIARLISKLLSLQTNEKTLAEDINLLLLEVFQRELRTLGIEVIRDLLASPLVEAKELGAQIILQQDERPPELLVGVVPNLIRAEQKNLRTLGLQILSQMPEEALLVHQQFLINLFCTGSKEIRMPIQQTVQTLASRHTPFAQNLARSILQTLKKPEAQEGTHQDLLQFFLQGLKDSLVLSKKDVLDLINAESSVAQELGGRLLQEKGSWSKDIDMLTILSLASHEVHAVREASWALCENLLPQLKKDPSQLALGTKLLDAKWEDSRTFAKEIFEKTFGPETLTPEVLVGICDSTYQEIRAFGQKLITRYFQKKDGMEYLLKLSEHPSTDLQLFASNYLERYAKNNVERLEELRLYFLVILSQINRGRVAKKRILHFLSKEAQKSEEAATLVAEIFSRQSVTVAIEEKAKLIETMLDIQQKYPDIPLPLQRIMPRVRNEV